MEYSSRVVLVVDDYAENRATIAKMLAKLHVDVMEASDGESALKLMADHQPAVVLLDADMPDLDGYQVINRMHNSNATRNVPVILMTANLSDRKQKLHHSMLDAVDFIHKPIHELTLLSKIESHLELDHYRDIIRSLHDDNEKMLEAMQEGVLGIDMDGVIRFANSAAAQMLKTRASKLQDTYLESLFEEPNHNAQSQWSDHPVAKVCAQQSILQVDQADFWCSDGTSVKVKFAAVPMEDLEGVSIILAFKAITDNADNLDQITLQRSNDFLTGLPTRQRFEDILQDSIKRASTTTQELAVITINLDHFRYINDTLGHDLGDKLLKSVSQRILRVIRKNDVLCRMGGDEFTLLLEPLQTPVDAAKAAKKIMRALKEVFLLEGHEIFTSCSIGIATYPACGDTSGLLLKHADVAVLKAKELGRNSFQYFSTEIHDAIQKRVEFERDLCQALRKEELALRYLSVFQMTPKGSAEPFGLEIELEWRHPTMGTLPVSEFMTVAEEMDQFSEMTRWMCDEAFHTIHLKESQVQTAGGQVQVGRQLFALISLKQLLTEGFLEWLHDAMTRNSISGDQLILGISEYCLIRSNTCLPTVLDDLHSLGIKFAIVDFGVGFGTFELMRSLKIDIVRLPEKFVRELATGADVEVICRHITAMAHELGIKVWAKQVDSAIQLKLLQQIGIDFIQGMAITSD